MHFNDFTCRTDETAAFKQSEQLINAGNETQNLFYRKTGTITLDTKLQNKTFFF